MGYRGNLGCLWILLFIFLIGGTPFLIGVARIFLAFVVIVTVGGWLGSWWIRRKAVEYYTSTQSESHNRFVELLVELLVRLAEIDGELNRSEVTAIRRFFQERLGYRDERLVWLRDLIKISRGSTRSTEEICARLATDYGLQERFIVLQVLVQVAQADGRLTAAETAFVEQVAGLLGLGAFVRSFASAGAGAGWQQAGPSMRDRTEEALSELGLEQGAGATEIKQAWRQLSKENHPDRVNHLGGEFRRLAEERMRKINAAYDTLKEAGLAE